MEIAHQLESGLRRICAKSIKSRDCAQTAKHESDTYRTRGLEDFGQFD